MDEISSIREIFTNREIAAFIWLSIVIVWLSFNRSIRKSLLGVLTALCNKYILISIAALMLYTLAIVYSFYRLSFWDLSDLKDTIYWFFGVAFVMLVNVSKADNEKYFKKVLLGTITTTAILEFLVNLYDFDLWLELILLPLLTILILMRVITSEDEKYSQLDNIFGKVQAYFGIALLLYLAYRVISGFKDFATFSHLLEFILPMALTAAYLPFIYLTALYSNYEGVFVRLNQNADKKLVKLAKRKILLKFHIRLRSLNLWSKKAGMIRVRNRQDVSELFNEE